MITLCIIAKPTNEEAIVLERCLNSVAKYVDEICITITGKNKAVEVVAKKFNAKVSYFEWCNDFAEARNFNFAGANGDWVLWLDCDDEIKGGEHLKNIIKAMDENGVDVGIADYLYDFDKYGKCVVRHRKTRIVKNDDCIKWMGNLHEDLIEQRNIKAYLIEDFQVLHRTNPERIKDSQKRNLQIALEVMDKDKDDPKNIWDVANAYLALGENKKCISYYLDFINCTGSEEEKFLAWHRVAGALKDVDDFDRAINAELEALKLRPWYPDPYLGLGEIYFKMGQRKHAKEFLIQGLSKEVPKDTAIVWNPRDYDFNPLRLLATVYYEMAKPEEAIKCLNECLRLYPKNKEIKDILVLLEKEAKKLRKIDVICEKIKEAKTKEQIKELIDSAPVELQSHPKLIHIKNVHFIKTESSGKDLVIYCYMTDEPFDPDIIQKEGRGGSEEAVYHISKRLAEKGWNVTVYANCGHKERLFGKVLWKPFWAFNPRDKQDILISWRSPALFEIKEVNATKKYVWLHDIVKQKEFTIRRLEKTTKIFALSKWQRDLFPDIPDNKFMITGNGIEVIKKKIERDPHRIIYTSSYDRGLETLLKLFPLIKEQVPEAELHIFYGWNLWDQLYKNTSKEMMEAKERMVKMMEQPGVYEHGRISQEQINEEYQKASILAYPTEFGEISFITGMKAQAYGCIPVTTNVAALDETIQYGLKVDTEEIYSDENAQGEWLMGVVNLLKNPLTEKDRQEMMDWAEKKFDWDKITEQWDKEFKGLGIQFKGLKDYKEFYNKREFPDMTDKAIETSPYWLVRAKWIKGILKGHSILDVGCQKGVLSLYYALQGKMVVGFDINENSINSCNDFVKRKKIDAAYYVSSFEEASIGNEFDNVFICELIEHILEPEKLLDFAEAHCSYNGTIFLTTPNYYGQYGIDNFDESGEHIRLYKVEEIINIIKKRGKIINQKIGDIIHIAYKPNQKNNVI